MLLRLLVRALPCRRGGLRGETCGQHTDGLPLRVIDTPARPCRDAARRCGQRACQRRAPQDDISALADRRGPTRPVARALVGSHDRVPAERAVREPCGAVLIGHHDRVHASGGQVGGDMDPPGVASLARMPQPSTRKARYAK